MGIDSLLEPASSGHLKNYSFQHVHIGFIFQTWRLLLAVDQTATSDSEKCKKKSVCMKVNMKTNLLLT